MTAIEVQAALALMDGLLTMGSAIANKIEAAKREGLVSVEQQQAQMDKLAEIRAKVGVPEVPPP